MSDQIGGIAHTSIDPLVCTGSAAEFPRFLKQAESGGDAQAKASRAGACIRSHLLSTKRYIDDVPLGFDYTQLRKAQAPKGTPAINKKSKSICKQQHQGDFLMRVQKNVLRKEHDKVHKKATQSKASPSFLPPSLSSLLTVPPPPFS